MCSEYARIMNKGKEVKGEICVCPTEHGCTSNWCTLVVVREWPKLKQSNFLIITNEHII